MAQVVWNGFLRVSLVSCPVHLSPAATPGGRINLDDVNSRTGNPVTEQFVDAKTGDVVAPNALAKGYKVDGATYVVLSEIELKEAASTPDNILDIEQFVPSATRSTASISTLPATSIPRASLPPTRFMR